MEKQTNEQSQIFKFGALYSINPFISQPKQFIPMGKSHREAATATSP